MEGLLCSRPVGLTGGFQHRGAQFQLIKLPQLFPSSCRVSLTAAFLIAVNANVMLTSFL